MGGASVGRYRAEQGLVEIGGGKGATIGEERRKGVVIWRKR